MKPLRTIHFVVGVLATVLVALIAAPIVLSPFKNAECSSIEGLGQDVKNSLESYRQTHGTYPDSLQALTSLSLPQNGAIYRRMGRSPTMGAMRFQSQGTIIKMPNKPDAMNRAMALRFAIEDQWHRVTDLER